MAEKRDKEKIIQAIKNSLIPEIALANSVEMTATRPLKINWAESKKCGIILRKATDVLVVNIIITHE